MLKLKRDTWNRSIILISFLNSFFNNIIYLFVLWCERNLHFPSNLLPNFLNIYYFLSFISKDSPGYDTNVLMIIYFCWWLCVYYGNLKSIIFSIFFGFVFCFFFVETPNNSRDHQWKTFKRSSLSLIYLQIRCKFFLNKTNMNMNMKDNVFVCCWLHKFFNYCTYVGNQFFVILPINI